MPIRIVNDNEEFENEYFHDEENETIVSFLKIGEKEYNICDAFIIGLFVENESNQVSWSVEVQIDSEDEIFESFSDIYPTDGYTIDDISLTEVDNPEDLELITYEGDLNASITKVVGVSFGDYDYEINEIPCTIEAELDSGEEYFLQSNLEFRGYYYFTQNKNSVKNFVEEYLGYEIDDVEIEYEKQEDGSWLCMVF